MYSIDGSTIANVISALLVSLIANDCAMLYISSAVPGIGRAQFNGHDSWWKDKNDDDDIYHLN